MGREVRRVPKDWEHPRYPGVIHKPLRGNSFSDALKEHEENKKMWDDGWVLKNGNRVCVPCACYDIDSPIEDSEKDPGSCSECGIDIKKANKIKTCPYCGSIFVTGGKTRVIDK